MLRHEEGGFSHVGKQLESEEASRRNLVHLQGREE